MSWELALGFFTSVVVPLIVGFQWGRKRKGSAEAVGEELKNQKSALDLYYETVAKLEERDGKIESLTKLVQEVSDQNVELLRTTKQKDDIIDQMKVQIDKMAATIKRLEADYKQMLKLQKEQK